jgi:YfiH family protein
MIFKQVLQDNGMAITSDKISIFFGNKKTQEWYSSPPTSLSLTKQVHGNKILEIEKPETFQTEADGLVSSRQGIDLGVITADCVPILAYCQESNQIASIHSGWKSTEMNIVSGLFKTYSFSPNTFIFIGPHIHQRSFEFDNERGLELIENACPGLEPSSAFYEDKNQKIRIDLYKIILHQLIQNGIDFSHINYLAEDTYTNMKYHSYRRDGKDSGRQISTIRLL